MKNNVAMTAFLLDAKELKPHDLAREVYEKAPTNSAYASTYAYSLHLQEKDADALKVLQTLQPKQLEDPSIAGYYGLILKATGDKAKARVYLNWAFKAPMLPEERKLFEQARAGA
jgi:Flp pilus assembly protein TadD